MPRPNRGPYIEPGDNGNYEIRWTENGRSKRRSTGASNYAQAQRILAHFILLKDREEITELRDVLLVRDILGDPSIPQGVSYWHSHVLPNAATNDSMRAFINNLNRHFGNLKVVDVCPTDVLRYRQKRASGEIGIKPAADTTIRRELGVLTAAINFAVKKTRQLKSEDAPTIDKPPAGEAKGRWLRHEEADRLLAAARGTGEALPEVYKFIVLALGTASRKGALNELEKQQIDFEQGLIYLNPPGRRQTAKRRVPVPIADWLRPILEQIVKEAKGERLLNAHLTNRSRCQSIEAAFRKACKEAGLEDVTPHTLRHTWGTWAAQAGVPLTDIAGVMGDTMETVFRNYLHHCPDHLRSAVNAVRRAA